MTTAGLDRISGKSRTALLQQIQKDSITLQMILTGRNYERLTVVADLKEEAGRSFVLVDCPEGLAEEVPDHEGAKVRIEFLGKDRIQYAFESRVTRIRERDLWLEMPEYVEKVQRRQFFRIAPPIGTRITFSRIGRPQEASLINVSEGGALVMLNGSARGLSGLILGESLRDVRLKCNAENVRTEITIDKATVLRQQAEHGSTRATYALKFLEMSARDRRLLQEFIFMCQREILRKRNEMGRR